MFIKMKKTIGAVLVLVGLIMAAGLAGTSDIGSAVSFLKLAVGAGIGIVMMGAGAVLIEGGQK